MRSPLLVADDVGFAAALEGRPIPAEGAFPKKSKPRSESCGLLAGFAACAGVGAGGAVRVGLESAKSAVLGLTGGGGAKSPNRLTFGAARGCGGGG